MNENEIDEFANFLELFGTDRDRICTTLANFPDECRSRGMFATGVLDAVVRKCGQPIADGIQARAGYPAHITSFVLYPHLDFYRLFYASAVAMYPELPVGEAMRAIAESFYPIFSETLVGRTMGALIGKTPEVVLRRFVEAYKIATPWNEHAIVAGSSKNGIVWKCMVEPCHFYPDTFAGICTGMVRTVTGITPEFTVLSRDPASDHQRLSFQIRW